MSTQQPGHAPTNPDLDARLRSVQARQNDIIDKFAGVASSGQAQRIRATVESLPGVLGDVLTTLERIEERLDAIEKKLP
jgi:hypothetical protein